MRNSSGMKAAILKRILPPSDETVTDFSHDTGVSTATIHYWKKQAADGVLDLGGGHVRPNQIIGKPIAERNRKTASQGGTRPKTRGHSRFGRCRRSGRRLYEGVQPRIRRIQAVMEPFAPGNRHMSPEGPGGGTCQLRRSGSNPGEDRPILTRCRRIRLSSSGSSMTAITFISAPHFGHTNGSTS